MKLSAKYWLGIIAVLLLVMWLGARKLNADGIWYDEWFSLYIAGADTFHISRSVGDIWQRISTEDMWQAPLYAFSLAGWGSLVGWTEFATRALSLLAGLIGIAGVFRLGWSISKRPLVGLGAATLLGTSVWYIYFLHEMRVYMILVMFTALMLLLYRRIMYGKHEPRWWSYVALTLISGLLVNSHYFAVLPLAVVGLWHVVQFPRKRLDRRWWGVIGTWVIAALALIPSLINIQKAATLTHNQQRVASDLALLVRISSDTFTAFSNTSVAVLIVLLAFSWLARPVRWVWVLGVVLFVLNLAAYYVFGLPELRYNMALLPFLALLAGFGLDELAKRRIPPLLIVTVWAAGIIPLEGSFQMDRIIQHWPPQPIREMAQVLKPEVAKDDVIINLIGDEDRSTLAAHSLVYYMGDFGARIEVLENTFHPGVQIFADRLRQIVGTAERVWLLHDPRWTTDEWSLFEYVMNEQHMYHCATLANTLDMRIWGFGRVDPNGQAWQFGDGVHLSMSGRPHIKDGLVEVWLGYHIDPQVPANTYSVGLYLMDSSNQVHAQYDAGLPAGGLSCQAIDLNAANLPAGDYHIQAAVYNWQTGERLMSSAADGSSADTQTLGTVTISAP
ncbi:MAG: hypothetical protein GC179_10730 [Anaerolineaceae bacterium]|nr:hypothetical protein [Anaerolineaceae bacterium]